MCTFDVVSFSQTLAEYIKYLRQVVLIVFEHWVKVRSRKYKYAQRPAALLCQVVEKNGFVSILERRGVSKYITPKESE